MNLGKTDWSCLITRLHLDPLFSHILNIHLENLIRHVRWLLQLKFSISLKLLQSWPTFITRNYPGALILMEAFSTVVIMFCIHHKMLRTILIWLHSWRNVFWKSIPNIQTNLYLPSILIPGFGFFEHFEHFQNLITLNFSVV